MRASWPTAAGPPAEGAQGAQGLWSLTIALDHVAAVVADVPKELWTKHVSKYCRQPWPPHCPKPCPLVSSWALPARAPPRPVSITPGRTTGAGLPPKRPPCSRWCPERVGDRMVAPSSVQNSWTILPDVGGGTMVTHATPLSPGPHTVLSFSSPSRPERPGGHTPHIRHRVRRSCSGLKALCEHAGLAQLSQRALEGLPGTLPARMSAAPTTPVTVQAPRGLQKAGSLPPDLGPCGPARPAPGCSRSHGRPCLVVVGLTVGQALLLIVPVPQERLLTLGADKMLEGKWVCRAARGGRSVGWRTSLGSQLGSGLHCTASGSAHPPDPLLPPVSTLSRPAPHPRSLGSAVRSC